MLGDKTTEEVPKVTEKPDKKASTGRKVFDALAILTLIVFIFLVLFITIGTIAIPKIRGDEQNVETRLTQ